MAREEIETGSNVTLNNVIFATEDEIDMGSNLTIGTSNYCQQGRYSFYAFALDDIEFGSSSRVRGAQIISHSEINFGSDNRLYGVYGEARGEINYGSDVTFRGCETGLESEVEATMVEGEAGGFSLVR